jgi:glycosyltransferase involved in cell wall biosynthesis
MTIWYDFTTTVRNEGRSGIAKTEWSIGESLLSRSPAPRCFVLEGRRGLVEIDAASELGTAVYSRPDAVSTIVPNAVPTWRDRVRATLLGRYGRRAAPAIRFMSHVYQLPATAKRALIDVRQGRRRRVRRTPLIGAAAPGDVVVSMGADWDGAILERLDELKRSVGCHVVTMVYDLIPLTHTHLAFHNDPELFTEYFTRLARVSDLVTCISAQSRDDFLAFCTMSSIDAPRTQVLHLGESTPPDSSTPEDGRTDFFLCVGTIERRKNLELVYDALRILELDGHELPTVVVAGAVGWGTKDLVYEIGLQATPASRAIVLLGSVSDPMLDSLYRRARALLFPSHFEGWGLPLREAAIRGCPVAAGDSPAVREAVAGFDGATLLPTDDAGPWAEYLMRPPMAPPPAPVREWSAVVDELTTFIDMVQRTPSGAAGVSSRRSGGYDGHR